MLILEISGDEFKLVSNIKRQMKLKRELLSRYRGDVKVKINKIENKKVVTLDECLLEDLFQ